MYEKLCEKAKLEQADMVFCNFNIVENGTDIKPYDEEKLKDMIYNKQFQLIFKSGKEYVKANIWRTLFKSDTFKNIRFDDRLYFGEDFVYMFKIFQTSCNMVLLDEYLYYYSLAPITMSKKYFNSKMLQNDKLYAKYAYEFLDNFNMHDYAVAAKYGSWIHLVHSILAYSSNYREEIELVMNDEFWQEVATKQNYKIFVKRLCANFKFKLRAFLLQHRKFSTYRYLVKKVLK